jgi:proteasome lid subunit RPN8/RPN11
MLILRLHSHFVELLKHETEKVHPVEACALLFGQLTEDEAVLEKVVVTQNKLLSSTRFEVDPATISLAVIEAEKERLDFVGLFHSHPAPAVPSVVDQKFMRLWPDVVWLILSSTDFSMSAFQLIDGEVKQVAIRIE